MDIDEAWEAYKNRSPEPRNPELALDAEALQNLLADPAAELADVVPYLVPLIRTFESRILYYNNAPLGALDTLPLENWPDEDLAKRVLWMFLSMLRATPGSEHGLEDVMMHRTTHGHPGGR